MSTPAAAESWPPCPFQAGHSYRVRRSFTALRDVFKEGEVLVFESCAWSRYDGITGYFFSKPGQVGTRAWDLPDELDFGSWREFFEEIPS